MSASTPESFLSIESREDVVVARISSQLFLGGQIAEGVAEKLLSILPDLGGRRLLIDFANVRSVTSLMLGKLIHLNNSAKKSFGKSIILFNVAPNIRKTLDVTKLDQILTLCEDEANATEVASK